jgi:ATP-dependent Lon protease
MISAFTGRPVSKDLAMTGEITLRGEVLPIGGVKEKVLAAKRAKIRQVLLPKFNRRDVEQISPNVLAGLEVRYVGNVDEVLAAALLPAPAPVPASMGSTLIVAPAPAGNGRPARGAAAWPPAGAPSAPARPGPGPPPAGTCVGIGDDAAVVDLSRGRYVRRPTRSWKWTS